MSTEPKQQSVKILKALADDVRLNVVKHIAEKPGVVSSCDVVQSCSTMLELSQPAMSHHFKKLVEAGILSLEKHKTENYYRINRELCETYGIDVNKL